MPNVRSYIAKRWLLLLSLFFLLNHYSYTQLSWPNDSIKAKQKYALYQDAFLANEYTQAIEPLQWLLKEAPNLHKSLYINGEKIYKKLALSGSNDSLRLKYQHTQLQLYDLRIQNFGEEAKILNRKANAAYNYFKAKPEKYGELFALFEKILRMDEDQILVANLAVYMKVIKLYHTNVLPLSDDIILQRYDLVSSMIHQKKLGSTYSGHSRSNSCPTD